MVKTRKKNRWTKFRHKLIVSIARVFISPYVRLKYRVKVSPFKKEKNRQFLILLNHQTAYDQFLVSMAFKRPVYFVASEDLFSNGFVSKLLRWAVAPIPIKKQANDSLAVMNCMRVAKEGGTIAIAPEGNRTYSGTTEYLKPSIVKLVKILKLPVAIFRIEGGYGVHPRWSDGIRRGVMKSYVSKVIEAEEIKKLSDDELLSLINTELYVDDYTYKGKYVHKKKAEYLERAIYVCPKCGFSNFESRGNFIKCNTCGLSVEYGEDKLLSSNNQDFTFKTVKEWYDYQADFVRKSNLQNYIEKPLYVDDASFFEVVLYKRKRKIAKKSKISIYANKFVVEYLDNHIDLDFDNVSAVSVLGKNKLNVYHLAKVYQFKGSKRFNALKYVNLYYHAINGGKEGEFLGI